MYTGTVKFICTPNWARRVGCTILETLNLSLSDFIKHFFLKIQGGLFLIFIYFLIFFYDPPLYFDPYFFSPVILP